MPELNLEPEPNSGRGRGLQRVGYELRASGVRVRGEPPNPLLTGVHSRGYLPHVKREGASYFVTFRLADSLPRTVLIEMERRRLEIESGAPIEARPDLERELREFAEQALDRGLGECHLRRPEIAGLVAEALGHFHGEQYLLDDWVVMPNHVHCILWPMPNQSLSRILQSRKRHTARQANLLLGRTGEPFWQPESYDHWIREEEEKARLRRYIRNNPVAAGLCRTPEEWRWGSAGRGGVR